MIEVRDLHKAFGDVKAVDGISFAVAPIGAIYYPVDALPGWLQVVTLSLPSAHTFEGMCAARSPKSRFASMASREADACLRSLPIAIGRT